MNLKLNLTLAAAALLLVSGCLANLDLGSAETETDGPSTDTTAQSATDAPLPGTGSVGSLSDSTSTTETTETTGGSTQSMSVGSSAGDSSSSSETGSGLPICPDDGTRRTAQIELGPNLSDKEAWENVDSMCFVAGYQRGGGSGGGPTSEYTLECDEGEADPTTRRLFSAYLPALEVGMTVRLRYLREYVIDGGFYWAFAIHDTRGELIVGNYRNNLPPNAPTDPATFFAPFAFESVDGLCASEPDEAGEGGGSFIIDPCPFIRTPLGVRIESGVDETTILDGTSSSFAGYEFNIFAGFAEYVDADPSCGDGFASISVFVFSEAP